MAHILQSGNIFRPTPSDAVLRDELPRGVYTLENGSKGYYFLARDPFRDLPPIYGDHERWAKRILDTFARKDSNMGVLLAGEKGGGKSLLGKLVARNAVELNMPTILIAEPHSPRAIGEIIAALESPALIFIDEFEKIYSSASGTQEEFLSILDGTSGSRHLFLLTVNDPERVNHHMLNRPGRIHYRIDFEGIDESFIRSYCRDNLELPDELEDILLIASCFERFNFDQLSSLVQEINAYREPALRAVQLLNISPITVDRDFAVTIVDAEGVKQATHSTWRGNVLTAERIHFEHWPQGDRSWPIELTVTKDHAVIFDAKADVYSFTREGFTVTLRGKDARINRTKWWDAIAQTPQLTVKEN